MQKYWPALFPFVRIDFYDYNGKPVLGEMTFTPGCCMNYNYSESGLQFLGEMLKLPTKCEVISKASANVLVGLTSEKTAKKG